MVGWHHAEAAIISCEVNCSIPVLGGVSALHCHAWKNAKPISTALVQLLNSCWFEGPMATWSSTCNHCKDAVGPFYPWMVCIISMKLEMIYETAQNSFKKTHLEGRYCIQYDSHIMLPRLDTYWVIWWTLFWYQYISDHTSKIIQYGQSSASISTMWNFPKAEKWEQEYRICQQQTNDQTAKRCKYVRWLNKQQAYVWKCDYNWTAIDTILFR